MACLEVFALGGETESDDAADTGYYGIRLALAWPVTHATHYVARHGLAAEGGPILASLVSAISTRFGVAVSEKMAAMAVPLIGAAGAATINLLFMAHFQEMARGHFVVRRLERKYGKELVQGSLRYQEISTGATIVTMTLRGDVGGDRRGARHCAGGGSAISRALAQFLAALHQRSFGTWFCGKARTTYRS